METISDRILIEEASVALVREYLSRKGCKNSLQLLEEELPRSSRSISNRAELAQSLHLAPVMRKNKNLENPFRTIIETIIWDLLKQHHKNVRESQTQSSRNTGRPNTARPDLHSSLIRKDKMTDKQGDLEMNDVDFDSAEITLKPAKYRENVTFFDEKKDKTVLDTNKESSGSYETINHPPASSYALPASHPKHSKSARPQSSRGSRNFNATVMPSDLRPRNHPTKSKLTKRQASSVLEMLSASPEKVISSKEKTTEAGGALETGKKHHDEKKMIVPESSQQDRSVTHDNRNNPSHELNATELTTKTEAILEDVEGTDEDLAKNKCSSWLCRGSKTSSLTQHLVGKDTFYDIKTNQVDLPSTFKSQKPNDKTRTEIKSVSINAQRKGEPIDYEIVIKLRELLFGSASVRGFTGEWINQSFSFQKGENSPKSLRFGIVQKKGGPCGVLASVQALMLKHLLFGKFCNNRSEVRQANPSQLEADDILRTCCLCEAIVELLWRIGQEKRAVVALLSIRKSFTPIGKYIPDDITEYLTTIECNDFETLHTIVCENINQFESGRGACILLLYSAILSRGFDRIKEDMDVPGTRMMGAHSYCSQEMVNLLTLGYAASNIFNDVIELDGAIFKGITTRGDVGLLSLFEHYKSCKVGSNLKTPKYPIWIVCSESHFSVLFCLNRDLVSDWTAERLFHLYYYDGLANQDEEIKLTVNTMSHGPPPAHGDLIPPLELCIQTKWPDANIDWNGTDPIL